MRLFGTAAVERSLHNLHLIEVDRIPGNLGSKRKYISFHPSASFFFD